jgi:hypothetical protein
MGKQHLAMIVLGMLFALLVIVGSVLVSQWQMYRRALYRRGLDHSEVEE